MKILSNSMVVAVSLGYVLELQRAGNTSWMPATGKTVRPARQTVGRLYLHELAEPANCTGVRLRATELVASGGANLTVVALAGVPIEPVASIESWT